MCGLVCPRRCPGGHIFISDLDRDPRVHKFLSVRGAGGRSGRAAEGGQYVGARSRALGRMHKSSKVKSIHVVPRLDLTYRKRDSTLDFDLT